jgi:hypothetical protein
MTQRTTPAPESATNEVSDDSHLAWFPDLEFAYSHGVDVRSLCGKWVTPWIPVYKGDLPSNPDKHGEVEVVGDLVPLLKAEDCPACSAVVSAHYLANPEADQ